MEVLHSSQVPGRVCVSLGCAWNARTLSQKQILGIGEATAFQFAKHGAASLAISDINLSSLGKVAQRLRDEHPHVEVEVLYIDTSNEQSIIDAHEVTIQRFGRIDYAVNNAGVAVPFRASVDTSREQFMFGIDINMVGVWLCQREQIKHMLKQEGLTPGYLTIPPGRRIVCLIPVIDTGLAGAR